MFFGSGPYAATPFSAGVEPAASIKAVLAAQEEGLDTASIIGGNGVGGLLAAHEVGADAFAGAGYQPAFGDLAVSETGADTFAANARLIAAARLAAQETGADTFASSGFSTIQGYMLATEADDIFDGLLKVPAFRMTGGSMHGVISTPSRASRYASSRR